MSEQGYDYESHSFDLSIVQYEFKSVSKEKVVKKIVEYVLIDKNISLYNLALLDVDKGGVSDISVTDNKDMPKIMATVYQTLVDFFVTNPGAKVAFRGNTASRNRLYRAVIGKLVAMQEPGFRIFGFVDGNFSAFQNDLEYEAYLIQL